jgi:DNA (cytosine-5)-methyltransferase 1
MRRLVDELRPAWVIGENVAGHVSMGLDAVLSDLVALGYACRAFVIPAVALDAKHERMRVWTVAHADDAGRIEQRCTFANAAGNHTPERGYRWSPEPGICRVAHGVPSRVDRLRGLGNAVVPQIPEIIGRAILAAEANA